MHGWRFKHGPGQVSSPCFPGRPQTRGNDERGALWEAKRQLFKGKQFRGGLVLQFATLHNYFKETAGARNQIRCKVSV